jgi:hypothetical protein
MVVVVVDNRTNRPCHQSANVHPLMMVMAVTVLVTIVAVMTYREDRMFEQLFDQVEKDWGAFWIAVGKLSRGEDPMKELEKHVGRGPP